MTIGILIPTYNRKGYLVQALQSARDQTFGDLEIIVIDNDSTDGTGEFMSGVVDPRVRYIINDHNLGMAGSINKGIRLFSDGVEWCMVLCDDDTLHLDFVKQMATFLAVHPEMLVAYGHIVFTDERLNDLRHAVDGPDVESAISYLHARTYTKRESYLSSLFFHKRSFFEIEGYPRFTTGWATDDALIFHLAARAGNVGFNRSAICYIRIHDKAESVSIPGGFKTHYQTALDFKSYCMNVARRYGLSETAVLGSIDLKIKGFLYVLFTTQYSTQLKFIPDSREHDEFQYMLLQAYRYLPIRIKVDYLCYSRFGITLERLWLYRMIWKVVGEIYKTFRSFVPLQRFIDLLHKKNEG